LSFYFYSLFRSYFKKSIFLFILLFWIAFIPGCSSEQTIDDTEYIIYNEILKYINEFADLNYNNLSNIIIDDKTHAIVYIQKYCGNQCGTGSYLFYYKVSDSWKNGAIFRVWTK